MTSAIAEADPAQDTSAALVDTPTAPLASAESASAREARAVFTYRQVGDAMVHWAADPADLAQAKPGDKYGPLTMSLVAVLGTMVGQQENEVSLPSDSPLAVAIEAALEARPGAVEARHEVQAEHVEDAASPAESPRP